MKDLKKPYTKFHLKNKSNHLYPTEWIIRTMLGSYPLLKLDVSNYKNGKILDLGFGDGRNWKLLYNCGLTIYGVEITEETVKLGYENAKLMNLTAQLSVGSNNNIPYENNFFDYILASSSCYYVNKDSTFNDNLFEILRVLKRGGTFICNFPAFVHSEFVPESFILEKAIRLDDGHIIIQNDIYGLRNGYTFKTFNSKEEIIMCFESYFEDISISICMDNYYGVQINQYIVVAKKKS